MVQADGTHGSGSAAAGVLVRQSHKGRRSQKPAAQIMTTAAATGPVKLTEYGIPVRNVWYMLLYTWGQHLSREKWRAEVEAAPTLDALLARILAAELEQRLRIGLGREYVTTSARLRSIRGKIDFPRSLRKQLFDRGEAHCHYQTFAVDAPRNQIIKSTLVRLIGTGDFNGGSPGATISLRQRLRRLVRDLDGVSILELTPQLVRRQQFGRNDRDYELMLNICLFLLERSLLTEQAGAAASLKADRDALQLSTVFEQFVAAFYRHHLHDWNVNPQKRLAWPTPGFVPHLPGMIADLVLTSPAGEMLVLDKIGRAHV